jgi:hypothetical protein
VTEKKEILTPREQALKDADWFLARARRRLWHGFGVRHDLAQARLAINALMEMEGEAEIHRVQR